MRRAASGYPELLAVIGLIGFMTVEVLQGIESVPWSVELDIRGIRVTAQDALLVLVFACSFLVSLRNFPKRPSLLAVLILATISVFIVIKSSSQGWPSAVADLRPWLYGAVCLYGASQIGAVGAHRVLSWATRLGVAVSLAIAFLAIGAILGLIGARDSDAGPEPFYEARWVSAPAASYVLLAVAFAFSTLPKTQMAVLILSPLAAGASYIRSIWIGFVAVLSSSIFLFLWTRRQRSVRTWLLYAMSLGLFTTAVAVFGTLLPDSSGQSSSGSPPVPVEVNNMRDLGELERRTDSDRDLDSSGRSRVGEGEPLAEPGLGGALSSGSLEWRLSMWRDRLPTSVAEVVVGKYVASELSKSSSDAGFNRGISAHSHLIEAQAALGIMGLVLLVIAVYRALRQSWSSPLKFCSLMGGLMFGLFFSWPLWTWILVGMSLSQLEKPDRACRPQRMH